MRSLSNRLGTALMRPLWDGCASIFLLHRLSDRVTSASSITIDSITETLNELRAAGAHFVSVSHLFELAIQGKEPEPGSVAFTIDDGFADQAVLAREGFERNGCPITIFLITDFIDGRLWPWDDQLAFVIDNTSAGELSLPAIGRPLRLDTAAARRVASSAVQLKCKSVPWNEASEILEQVYHAAGLRPPAEPPASYRPLSWDQIRALESGHIEFAPHSVTHRIASRLSAGEVTHEIEESWARVRQELARPVPVYAWPTGRDGDFGVRDMEIAARVGLHGAVSVNNDYASFRARPGDSHPLFGVRRFSMSAFAEDNLQYGTAIEKLKQSFRLRA